MTLQPPPPTPPKQREPDWAVLIGVFVVVLVVLLVFVGTGGVWHALAP